MNLVFLFFWLHFISKSGIIDSAGYFEEQLIIDEMKFSVYYKSFDVIGEHSHKTNTINFKEI